MREYLQLFWTFFKIGSFTFGGGFAMLAMIEREIIERQKWMSKDEFFDLLAIAQSSPGPIALNVSVFIGYKVKGKRGALFSMLGSTIPSFIIILLVAMIFGDIIENPIVEQAFMGMRPAVVALIVAPLISLAKSLGWGWIVIGVVAACLITLLGVSPVLLLIVGAVGNIIYQITRK